MSEFPVPILKFTFAEHWLIFPPLPTIPPIYEEEFVVVVIVALAVQLYTWFDKALLIPAIPPILFPPLTAILTVLVELLMIVPVVLLEYIEPTIPPTFKTVVF